ncbi:MAG: pentapeptide repeat-containing protein [Myxococcaceae bacterium]
MAKPPSIETLLKNGSAEWNKARKTGAAGTVHTGATFANLFSANADLSALDLVGSEWEKCDLSKMNFRDTDLSNSYFHGGRLQDCDFRGANLEGATFERLKLLRCDFSGARGLDEIEFDEVDMDRVTGLDGQEAPPPPPPPAVGITSFTRDQRLQRESGSAANAEMPIVGEDGQELPEFRPQDPAGQLLYRELKKLQSIPMWALDVPGLRPHLPPAAAPGSTLESALREASRQRLEGRKPSADPAMVTKAQQALRMGTKDAAFAAGYLRETATEPNFRFSAAKTLHAELKKELDVDDLTASVDPRITGALLELRLSNESADALNEVRRRLGATQLFTALLEAGFNPENNWEEALDSAEQAQDLAALAGESREELGEAFGAFAALPEEARLRRLAYLGEAANHLEQLTRVTDGEPAWLAGPEYRECHDREMQLVQVLKASEIPEKVPELALAELGVPVGQVPEDSEDDLFIHFKCAVCGKEKLLVQTPE